VDGTARVHSRPSTFFTMRKSVNRSSAKTLTQSKFDF
jgi:hypothetical protein